MFLVPYLTRFTKLRDIIMEYPNRKNDHSHFRVFKKHGYEVNTKFVDSLVLHIFSTAAEKAFRLSCVSDLSPNVWKDSDDLFIGSSCVLLYKYVRIFIPGENTINNKG